MKKELEELHFSVQAIQSAKNPPLVIAQKKFSSSAKTIGIYGHYDVQPEDPLNEWLTKPFILTVKNGKFYGRGVADNKGPVVQNITAIRRLLEKGQLKRNIMFVLEGEEEIGSVHFEHHANKIKKVLSEADVFFLTDMGMHNKDKPQIMYGLRGILYFEIEVEIGQRDLHSGVYGNRVINPAQILSYLFSQMKDTITGKITIPGFYKRVRRVERKERILLSQTKRTDKEEMEEAQVYSLTSLDKENPSLSTKIYPAMDINGIYSGFTGKGPKTIIPRVAMAKFSLRLIEYQDPDEIENMVRTFIKKTIPKGVRFNLRTLSSGLPFYTAYDNPYIKKTAEILTRVFGHKTLINRSGGSIGAAATLSRLTKKPIVVTGFTLPDDRAHSPNENFDEEMFWKGIDALEKIYKEI